MSFDSCIEDLFKVEGGYVNKPQDHGGPTNYGITKATLTRWRQRLVSTDEIIALSKDEAKKIYKAFYWAPLKLDEIPFPKLQALIFDQSVNRGPSAITKDIQGVLGLHQDGVFGDVTLKSVLKFDPSLLAMKLFKLSQITYCKIVQHDPTQRIFIVGWINRTHRMLDKILAV